MLLPPSISDLFWNLDKELLIGEHPTIFTLGDYNWRSYVSGICDPIYFGTGISCEVSWVFMEGGGLNE